MKENKGLENPLVGCSIAMQEVRKLIAVVGPHNVPVLICGETGTGKELVARALHLSSERRSKPFVAVNGSALPESLLESELFGHRRGSFTGAETDKEGLLETADGGTFFIDEIGDMGLAIQAKLLRVIETGVFRKIGDSREIKVDVRLISATNKDLEKEMSDKTFRPDLYYRLSTVTIEVPPLRERREDIPLLVNHFLSYTQQQDKIKCLSMEALNVLVHYYWPGNVRELMNVLQRAALICAGDRQIDRKGLPLHILRAKEADYSKSDISPERIGLKDAQREHIGRILAATNGNKSEAARLLGISRTRIYNMLGRA